MNVTKHAQSSNDSITLEVERETLSDGSHVFNLRVGCHILNCVCQKDAERAFLCFEKGVAIIEGNLKLSTLEV